MTEKEPSPKRLQTPTRLILWGGLALFLLILALGLLRSQKRTLALGEQMPAFSLKTFDGREILSDDLNGKVVVINFWASWCKPCEEEAADMQAVWSAYQDLGVVFLGIDYVDTEPEALGYLKKFQITYPNGADLGTRISQAFQTLGVPETYVFQPDGTLVHVQIGPFSTRQQIEAVITPLLPDK